MRVFAAVIEVATLPMFHPRQDLALGRAVALQLIGDNDAWDVLQPLEQLTKELLRRLLVPAALHQNIQHVVVLIDGAPQVMALPVDGQKHFVQVPLVTWPGSSVLQLIGVCLSKLEAPLADGLVGHIDAAFEQQLLHVAVAQREAIVKPDPMADDLTWKAVVLVTLGVSRRGHAWLPILGFVWSVGKHRWGDYVTSRKGWSTT